MSSEDQIKIEEEQAKATRTWLLSFIDLLSLTLGFFVLMYATRDVSQEQFAEIKSAFIQYTNGEKPAKEYKFISKPGSSVIIRSASKLSYLETLFKNSLMYEASLNIRMIRSTNKIILEFDADSKNKAGFQKSLTDKMLALSKTINSLSNQIEVAAYGSDMKENIKVTEAVSKKIEELGYEYKILRTLQKNNSSESLEKNKNKTKIQIIINNYESVF